MVSYYKKISFLKIQESWFDGKMGLRDLFSLKVVLHLKSKKQMFGIKEITHTLELDLELEKETIFANFSKANRQQIRKSEESGVVIEKGTDIEKFVTFFNDFAIKKGTFTTSKERILEKKDCLEISFASYEGNLLAAQSYIVDKDQKIVRHYQTANKRFEDTLNKNFVGQANKYLLVTNLMRFKEEGYKIFDFGGYVVDTADESLLGINNYKIKFGGTIVECKDYYSVPYWLLKKIGRLLGTAGTV
jgi:lipid II:glycine glycyltransferase (peptidoglycan interpeptide bridge formation enzyme)